MAMETLHQILALPNMDGVALKKMWTDFFQSDPPTNNKTFLVKRLAFRIQELAYGGLSETTISRLQALADGKDDPKHKKTKTKPVDRLTLGTRLVREWQKVEHHCTVIEGGFEYQGRKYKSLSAVARAITGTQWNGPLFFGLRGGK